MTDRQQLHFGIKTTQYIPYADIVNIWQEAEACPAIEHAWLFDHPMPIGRADPSGPCLDGWTVLAALAAQTQRLRLGLLVASNANQPPAQLAKRAATLDVVSHGRLEFGIGAGGVEREHTAYGTDLFSPAERVRRLDEACQIIRRMWTEPVVDFDGLYYHIAQAYCEPKPVQKPAPPIIIGGVGEQLTLRVVAKQADVWNYPGLVISGPGPAGAPSVVVGVEEFQRKSRLLDGYCAEIGRDPGQPGALCAAHLWPRGPGRHPPDITRIHCCRGHPSGSGCPSAALRGHGPLAERRDHRAGARGRWPVIAGWRCLRVKFFHASGGLG